jgi:hypothetical protein
MVRSGGVEPGTIYEDCSFHSVLCAHVHGDDSVSGISLIDGVVTAQLLPGSLRGVLPLTVDDVIEIRKAFNGYVARRKEELRLG